ncbi:MAG: FkbM family methyltransferase [Alphaproteobacteria bacterium]
MPLAQKNRAQELLQQLRIAAEKPPETGAVLEALHRPTALVGIQSMAGITYAEGMRHKLPGAALILDDDLPEAEYFGLRRVTTAQFEHMARQMPLTVVDFSESTFVQGYVRRMCGRVNAAYVPFVQAVGALDLHAVYQTAQIMRTETLARLDDFIALGDKLADDASRVTLYGLLLLRLTFDRGALRFGISEDSDEYFATRSVSRTFQLGDDESFIDCGASTGPVLQKFLGATDWQFRAYHGFEPDPKNFTRLSAFTALELPNLHFHNAAVADKPGKLRFVGGADYSCRLDPNGNIEVPAVALDDVVPEASFIKMDIEGAEVAALTGARRLIIQHRPRLAVTVYHYAHDLLNIFAAIAAMDVPYRYRLAHYRQYYLDTVLYATASDDWD